MYQTYDNFVRPTTIETGEVLNRSLKGEEARRLYLEEVGNFQSPQLENLGNKKNRSISIESKHKSEETELSNLQLFTCVQNNDVDKLRKSLEICPDKINTVDEFGWSLLMIACQANSIEAVKELLQRGIDTSTRDRAGNSAQSLVIKNKNVLLADILLKHKNERQSNEHNKIEKYKSKRFKGQFQCKVCDNRIYYDKYEHLSSTIHNINASKGRKIPTNYVIPESNKGFQLMLRVGWDKEGLGPHGSGKKHPLKVVLKNDRTGLGHKKNKVSNITEDCHKKTNKKISDKHDDKNRRMEINFRREFY